jgi:hypothetical protein
MKKSLLTTLSLLLIFTVFGQKNEYVISLNSGLFSFGGKYAVKTTFINLDPSVYSSGYTDNPYGTQNGICIGLSGNFKHLTKRNFIAGFDFGFENLKSKVTINQVYDLLNSLNYDNATGKTFLNYHFLNLFPYIGHRLNFNALSVDLIGGIDVAYVLSADEKGDAVSESGYHYTTAVERKTQSFDLRPRVQVSADYNKFGVYVGYSYGVVNYIKGYYVAGSMGTNSAASEARLIRFGLTYRIK